MKTKIIYTALNSVLLCGLVACGGDDENTAAPGSNPTSTPTGLSTYNGQSDYILQVVIPQLQNAYGDVEIQYSISGPSASLGQGKHPWSHIYSNFLVPIVRNASCSFYGTNGNQMPSFNQWATPGQWVPTQQQNLPVMANVDYGCFYGKIYNHINTWINTPVRFTRPGAQNYVMVSSFAWVIDQLVNVNYTWYRSNYISGWYNGYQLPGSAWQTIYPGQTYQVMVDYNRRNTGSNHIYFGMNFSGSGF